MFPKKYEQNIEILITSLFLNTYHQSHHVSKQFLFVWEFL